MMIERCPDCDGTCLATVRKGWRVFRYKNGSSRRGPLIFAIRKKTGELVPMWEVHDRDPDFLSCQYCRGRGYLYDRLPYKGRGIDIGFFNSIPISIDYMELFDME